MKIHNGMRPQDIVVLLKIICLENQVWQYRDLAVGLDISVSEISNSIARSSISGLFNNPTRQVNRLSFMEFIEFGLKFVFPVQPERIVTGKATAHSHPFYVKHFQSEYPYVWPDSNGDLRGLSVDPLYSNVTKAAEKDIELYKLLAGIDILRIGKVREVKMALTEIKKVVLESQRKYS